MKNKITYTLFGILLIVIISMFWAKSIDEDSWVCIEKGWIQHGMPNSAKPVLPCGTIEEHLAVENYLKENISNISTEKEVLGGKFYINKIDWGENNSGTVEYEDGHILLNAAFDYKIQANNVNDYSIIIENFMIVK